MAEAEQALGVPIPDDAITQMRAHLDDIDFDAVAAYERRYRHDVMAHVHAFGDVAPAARKYIHLGATSAFVTDNADLILMRRGLDLLRGKLVTVVRVARRVRSTRGATSRRWAPHTSSPPSPPPSASAPRLWMQDLVLDLAELDHRRTTLPCRGVKGTTGTQASFLELFAGDHDKVRKLDRR